TVIIFTTNAGRLLYEEPNRTGVQLSGAARYNRAILDALGKDIDPHTGNPFFPAALLSRMGSGYPVMFNHLGINELEKVCVDALQRSGKLLEKTFFMPVEFDPLVSLCLLLGQGVDLDARTLTARAEAFVKEEIYHLSLLYHSDRLEELFRDSEKIIFTVEQSRRGSTFLDEFTGLKRRPEVLLVTDSSLRETWCAGLNEVEWSFSDDPLEVCGIIESREIDMVLLDLWTGENAGADGPEAENRTLMQFDYVPGAARGIARGREILRLIHEKHPETPCHLLSFGRKEGLQTEVDDELFQACVISGGARGVVHSALPLAESDEWLARLTPLADEIKGLSLRAYREKKLKTLGRERKSLFFETAPEVTGKDILIRLRNLQIKQNLAADDAAAVLSEMERPTTGFADVYGAAAAREELAYIVNWLRNPAKPTVLGLRPPRGILLYGAPGTGKTLLARALAGECKVPFLPVSATSFVTKWQGSGPENIRALFGRARNYAPAIIFIDEIDAIGKERGRGAADNAAEQTLNALLVEMDGFHSAAARPVIVIAATNLVGALDSALRRRFDREIEVDGPDRAARAAYLCRRLLDKPGCQVTETVLNRLAGSTAGRTIAELERIVELAGRMAHSSDNLLTDAIISEACERMLIGE
ncbi:MAG: AAA family ATPase, partial [Candidatus Cloacimonadota bacterium]|nr:AAA family ATPase [Candidatus Cloacimonadota bacterium]